MRRRRMLAAMALAGAGSAAMALPTMNYSAVVVDSVTRDVFSAGRPDPFSDGPFATPGTVSIAVGGASASVQAEASAQTGMFKSLTRASVTGGQGLVSSGAVANHSFVDTLSFAGTGAYTTASFTLSWDTHISGLAAMPSDTGDGSPRPTQRAESWQSLILSYTVANPDYRELSGCPPGVFFQIGNTEMLCPQPFMTKQLATGHDISSGTAYDGSITGDGNGAHTGSLTVDWVVPVGVSVRLVYSAGNYAACSDAFECDLTVDASHSDHVGIIAAPGSSFSSASGYQYLGQPMAPVPEPATWLLSLLGLLPLAVRARRRTD